MTPPHTQISRPEGAAIRVADVAILFDPFDASPLERRRLADDAARSIRERVAGRDHSKRLVVSVPAAAAGDAPHLEAAIRHHFAQVSAAKRIERRSTRNAGWRALAIGLVFVAALFGVADLVGRLDQFRLAVVISESIIIVAWVALWRPVDILLFECWPLRGEALALDAIAAMPIEIRVGA